MNRTDELSTVLSCLYEKLEKDAFIEFTIDNYENFDDIEQLLSNAHNEDYVDFESFVDLAIKTLKPDFDGQVYVKYNKYNSVEDDGDRFVNHLGEYVDKIHLNEVPDFITNSSDCLGVNLDDGQDLEIVFFVLKSGEYELPDSDIEGGTVYISIKEPELSSSYNDYEDEIVYKDDKGNIDSNNDDSNTPPDNELDDELKDF